MNVKKLGAWMLARAIDAGLEVVRDRAVGIDASGQLFRAVRLASGSTIRAHTMILAAGPLLPEWVDSIGLFAPIVNEQHGKISFEDDEGIIPRDVPLMIWDSGVHFRPRGEKSVLGIWGQIPFDEKYPHKVIRGLAEMVPGLARYIDRVDDFTVDSGYYCKTPDNRPLIGPTAVDGVYLIGALSGFGVMSSQAAAELVCAHVLHKPLPSWAPAFAVDRQFVAGQYSGEL
jgi:glycine/D-amino acid oxidase-like deaminating enzyme